MKKIASIFPYSVNDLGYAEDPMGGYFLRRGLLSIGPGWSFYDVGRGGRLFVVMSVI